MKKLPLTLYALAFCFAQSLAFAAIEGTYRMDHAALLKEMSQIPGYAQLTEAEVEKAVDEVRGIDLSISLKPGGFYTLSAKVADRLEGAEGTYRIVKDEIEFTVLFENGKKLPEPEIVRFPFVKGYIKIREEGMAFAVPVSKVE